MRLLHLLTAILEASHESKGYERIGNPSVTRPAAATDHTDSPSTNSPSADSKKTGHTVSFSTCNNPPPNNSTDSNFPRDNLRSSFSNKVKSMKRLCTRKQT